VAQHGFEGRRLGAGAQALEGRHQARLRLLLLGGSENDHEDRDAADRCGEAGAHQPAEAPFAQGLGVVDGIHIARAAGLGAAIERGRAAAIMPHGHRSATCNRGVTSMIDHGLAFPSRGPLKAGPSLLIARLSGRVPHARTGFSAQTCKLQFHA